MALDQVHPACLRICHCDLTSELYVIEEGTGCELCIPHETTPFTPSNVEKGFRMYENRLEHLYGKFNKERHESMNGYFKLMGRKCRDRVTKYEGIVSSICFDLYGCVQVSLTPEAKPGDLELKNGHWFDHKRLEVLDETPVMELPPFATVDDSPVKAPASQSQVGQENGPAENKPSLDHSLRA